MSNKNIMLISFYNKFSIAIRNLEAVLLKENYSVNTVFYKSIKGFNSVHINSSNKEELILLKNLIKEKQPLFIGLSVLGSMYIETVSAVIEMIKENFSIPIVVGGVFASLNPDFFLEKGARFVIRSDGEFTIKALANALQNGTDYKNIPNLCYKENDKIILNDIEVADNVDEYGIPVILSKDVYFIEENKISSKDPRKNAFAYDVIASRGCPFTCTYCSAPKQREQLPKGTKAVRMRSVQSVMEELKQAKKQLKNLSLIRFQDENFISDSMWINEFTKEYKKHINIPFMVWAHPKTVSQDTMQKLADAGLVEVAMGIQSGSQRVRKEVFHRYESNEDIINATKILSNAGIFKVYYDFILQHPFETLEDLKETYELVKHFQGKYMLHMHFLTFLPGTEIASMAVEAGFYTKEEMQELLYTPIVQKPFQTKLKNINSEENEIYHKMIYLLQFKELRNKLQKFENNPLNYKKEINKMHIHAQKLEKTKLMYARTNFVLQRISMYLRDIFSQKNN